jgi:DNA-binding transcriptional LysR family regulator
MNLNHLAVFHAVAEAGGVTAGAERLQISQPAASKQIRELEAALGVTLFDRAGRGVRLTEPGRVLAGYARRLFALESEAEQAVGELRAVERGTLLVGASTIIGSYLIPVVLSAFHRRYPGVRVHVEVGNTEAVHRALLEHRLDVGLTEGLVPGGGLDSGVFALDELVGIAAPGHPILGRRWVRAKEFAGLPFVLREPESGTRAVIELALGKLGLRAAEVMSVGSTEAIKRVVATGVGVAIVSRLAILSEEEAGTLAVVRLSDLEIPRPLHRVRPQGQTDGPALQAFDEVLAETLPAGFRYGAGRRG